MSRALAESVAAVLQAPAAAAVRNLQADLLEAGVSAEAPVWALLQALHNFLDQLATTSTSRQYSELASLMEIGALSGLVLEDVVTAADAGELAERLAAGSLTEGLAILATRQHVKAWQNELTGLYRETAFFLSRQLWFWATRQRPELPPAERRLLLEQLLAPVWQDSTSGEHKALLLVRLLQILIADALLEPETT